MAVRPEPGTFLALLSDRDREALLELGGSRTFARGERLMHQGEPGDRVLFLLEGHVKASIIDSRGGEMVLKHRGAVGLSAVGAFRLGRAANAVSLGSAAA